MSPDLKYLLLSVLLTAVQVLIAAAAANQVVGLTRLAGNRDGLPEMTGFAGRAKRAHLNMLENMVLFTALVLVASVGGITNPQVEIGARIFFWARIVYIPIYMIGIPVARTAVWAISVIGMGMIFASIVQAMP